MATLLGVDRTTVSRWLMPTVKGHKRHKPHPDARAKESWRHPYCWTTVSVWFVPNTNDGKGHKSKPDARLANGLHLIPKMVKGVNLVPMRG